MLIDTVVFEYTPFPVFTHKHIFSLMCLP